MEAILIFLTNAIASGAIGHYVNKGLGKIDKELSELLEEEADMEVIEKLVADKGIEAQVIEFANDTFKKSIILPALNSEGVTNKDKAELFLNLLKIGMELSVRLKIDLLLPSSFVTPNAFTLFAGNSKSVPDLTLNGVQIDLEAGATDTISNNLYIVPASTSDEKKKIWMDYLDNLSNLREEDESYLHIKRLSTTIAERRECCDIDKVTAGSCSFKYQNIMAEETRDMLGLSSDKLESDNWYDLTSEKTVKSDNWYEAISEMTQGMNEIMNIQVLPQDEVDKIREAYAHIQTVLDSHIN